MWFYYGPWITLEYSISMHAVVVGLSSDYLLKAVWLFDSVQVHKTRCRQCASNPCPRGRVPSKQNKQRHIRYKYNLHPSINLWTHNKKVVSGLGLFAYSVHLGLGLKYIFVKLTSEKSTLGRQQDSFSTFLKQKMCCPSGTWTRILQFHADFFDIWATGMKHLLFPYFGILALMV